MAASDGTFARALTLVRYNWPLYAFAAVAVVGGAWLSITSTSTLVRVVGGSVAGGAAWFAVASFLAFHAMFDRSPLLRGTWLAELLPDSPRRYVQVSVCLEETTLPLRRVFPAAEGVLLDLFSASVMTEPAVTRARAHSPHGEATAATPTALGVADQWSDATVITLAAHEVRDRGLRESLFRELERITAPDGRIVVVEHLRNLAALLAFGPGFLHFLPRGEWINLADQVGLRLLAERSMTPFVHVFVFAPRERL